MCTVCDKAKENTAFQELALLPSSGKAVIWMLLSIASYFLHDLVFGDIRTLKSVLLRGKGEFFSGRKKDQNLEVKSIGWETTIKYCLL
jgi:hypothetical protein